MAKKQSAEAQLRAESPLLTIKEAAIYLRAAPSWVRKLIAGGKLPYQQQGKSYLVLRRDLDAYIERCRTGELSPNIVKTSCELVEKKRA